MATTNRNTSAEALSLNFLDLCSPLVSTPWVLLISTLLLLAGAIAVFRPRRSFNSDPNSKAVVGGPAGTKQALADTDTDNGPAQTDVNANDNSLNKDREFGEWASNKFSYPSIESCPDRLVDIKPIPYRPFKWGGYHVTMGIRNMLWDDWIELDRDHAQYHRIKSHRIETRGPDAVRVLDGNEVVSGGRLAAVELVHELAEYLSRRYPSEFSVIRHCEKQAVDGKDLGSYSDWGWEGASPIQTVTITSLGVSYDLPLSVNDGEDAPTRAMRIASLLVQDDLAIMMEGCDGRYYFQAGGICVPGFWRMKDKIGLPLEEIHTTGNVPQYRERLQASLERFFRRLPVDKPVIRNNYFIQTNRGGKTEGVDAEELAWAESTVGPEDEYGEGGFRVSHNDPVCIEDLRLRTERQTLRRLGVSGAVVFTIRTYLFRIVDIAQEEGVAKRLASALRSWPEDVGEYKGKDKGNWWTKILEYLDCVE